MTELADARIGLGGPLARIGRLPLFAPLRFRDFRLVWFGESISLLGDQLHYVALSWLVLGLTGSGLALGTVLLAASLPRGAFLLVGGALSDRISPRRSCSARTSCAPSSRRGSPSSCSAAGSRSGTS
jgi:hypothetical protein